MLYRGLTLDPFQERAIEHLRDGRSVLVAAPTGTGKTLVADFIVDQALEAGKEVIYTAPVKALSNQKFRDYTRLHGEDRVGLVTGDLVIRRDAPCRVMTTEILRNMLLSGEELPDLAAVIFDELHFLGDRDRGTVWEEVMIYLPSRIQILGLSATLSNLGDFAEWLSEVRGATVEVVRETRRAVPLDVFYFNREAGLCAPDQYERALKKHRRRAPQDGQGGRRRRAPRGRGGDRGRSGGGGNRGQDRRRGGRRDEQRTNHLDVVRALEAEHLPLLYFVFSRRNAEGNAWRLSRRIKQSLLSRGDRAKMRSILDEVADPPLTQGLRALYMKGIGFHHAGLNVQLKSLVERLYEAKLLRVLYTTSTFALGINMPARTVALDGLEKYNGRAFAPLTVQEFMQKAGRAGRRGLDARGQVVVRLDFADYEDAKPNLVRYLSADPEPVYSSFNLSFNSVINLLARQPPERVRALVERSFLAFHLTRQGQQAGDQAAALESELRESGWTPEGGGTRETRRRARLLNRLNKRARRGPDRVWADFERRRFYLQRIGYIDEDGEFGAGGRVLQHLQIEEIFATELVLSGAVEELEDEWLYGVFCAMTNSLPRHVKPWFRLHGPARYAAELVTPIRFSAAVTGAEDITGVETTWDPNLIPIGAAWARGEDLATVSQMYKSDTDITGQLVGGFRRAREMANQLREVYRADPSSAERLRDLARRVTRDEVEVVA